MPINKVSLITVPSTAETLTATFVTGEQGKTTALLNARVTQLEEEWPKIIIMLKKMERLVRESLSKQRELEEDVQNMQESLKKQDLRHKQQLDVMAWRWRSSIEPIHARVEALEMGQMRSDEFLRVLSSHVAILEDRA
ncbi:hypothetical protein F4604DRAFT_1686366 [Suillus subluteus]|nr:hypothetical protein F4604DRAFT_1686366 [Suillus subluteus]